MAILIIEDNRAQREALEEFLTSTYKDQKSVYAAEDGELARAVIKDRSIEIVISDLMLPDITGIELVKEIRKLRPDLPFLILTGQPSIESAIEAIKAGANDYLLKPVDLVHLQKKIDSLLETKSLREENKQLRARLKERFAADQLIGNSPEYRSIIEKAGQIASADVTVLLAGESGTGKEKIANLIHENSQRAGGPFIKVNCGALTKTLLESELFGSVRGAYTGADQDRAGLFEAADGGTIFLDEIGEMDLESQVRLLRVLEEREVVRVGSTKTRKINVRLISATNRDLLTAVEDGTFREDLYYRIAVIQLELPPLRMRSDDIPLLINHFLVEFNEKYGKSVATIDPELMNTLQNSDWPGNIRQLRNVIEGMVVMANDYILRKENLPVEMDHGTKNRQKRLIESIIPGVPLEEYEKAIIEKNLNYVSGNREKTSKLLGVSERTLYRKIRSIEGNSKTKEGH